MSRSDRALIAIARALLSSLDLILISNLLDLLGTLQAERVMKIFREYTENRGLAVLATETKMVPYHLRKKKTVILSTKFPEIAELSDNWIILEATDIGVGSSETEPEGSPFEKRTPSPESLESAVSRRGLITEIIENEEGEIEVMDLDGTSRTAGFRASNL